MKELILYFSRAGENYFPEGLRRIEKGCTQIVAEKAAQITGADLLQVVPAVPYSDDYKACVQQAVADRKSNGRPAILPLPEDVGSYDLYTVMYPCYCGTMPMHMFTALEQIDFTGKTVRPLCTNEGSGMGTSEADIAMLCTGARILPGLPIRGSQAESCTEQLKHWLENC